MNSKLDSAYIMKFTLSQWNKALEFENEIRLIINFYFKSIWIVGK